MISEILKEPSNKYLVWFSQQQKTFGLTNNFEVIKNDYLVNKIKIEVFEQINNAFEYIKSLSEKLPLEQTLDIKSTNLQKTIFITNYELENNYVFSLRDLNCSLIQANTLTELPDDIINDGTSCKFDSGLNLEYCRLVTFIICVQVCEEINFDRLVFEELPSFELFDGCGELYKKLLVYAMQIQDEIKNRIIIEQNSFETDLKIYF